MTGVGAPGTQQQLVWPRDGLRALELACEAWEGHGAIVGTMTAHPGAFMAGTWLVNALDPHLAVIDCNANGRGHPTVAMGGMGLAGRTDITVVQAAVGGVEDHRGHIEIVARGPIGVVSDILHHASAATGGALLASRGPFPVEFLREHGAVGAVSACIRLGEAMIAAEGEGGEAMISAIKDTLGGRELGRGPLAAANVARARELGRRHARGRQRLPARDPRLQRVHGRRHRRRARRDLPRPDRHARRERRHADARRPPRARRAHRRAGRPARQDPARRGRARGLRLPRSRAAARDRARRRTPAPRDDTRRRRSRRDHGGGRRAGRARARARCSSRPRSSRRSSRAARSSTAPSTASG